MTTPAIGVGVDGTLPSDWIVAFAQRAEALGYGSFWYSVRPGATDPIVTLRDAVAGTHRMLIGVSAFPLDAHPGPDLGARVRGSGVPLDRVILGIASGQVKQGALRLVREGVATLRTALPGARIGVGAIGPNMLELGGRVGDAVLVNWLTPARLAWSRDLIAAGARAAGRPVPEVYLYHRAARGSGGAARIQAEMTSYRQWPVHARHQAAMGHPPLIGVVATDPREIGPQLRPYLADGIPVLRPLPENSHDRAEWQSLIEFFAARPE